MRTFTIILLICFFLFDSLGFYFLFENKMLIAKSDAGKMMKRPEGKNELVTIIISKNSQDQFSWNDDHEFQYKNEMYDVVSIKENGNLLIYTCYHDVNEANAVSELVDHVKNTKDPCSSRNASKKNRWETDKYFTMQMLMDVHQHKVNSSCEEYSQLPPDLIHCIILTQPPNCI
ncbi:MAG: hypothetical protein IPO83_07120 [Chitinophagaceae bacterium]|nr:hypothetical protein [Chitinophagaceae bacterium]